ncbi:DUF3291 domain-containing protein [Streptomyces sp. NPDC002187]|uniref:DUF3291 domain-containing protein n=1 Tax=Streptomyces sp. NPDC002187 TaxID=3364637 RepID=UPI0036D1B30F
MTVHALAQTNVSRLKYPLDSEELRPFVDAEASVYSDAEEAGGFVWRHTSGDCEDRSGLRVFNDDFLVVNVSVWQDLQALMAFMYRGPHRDVMARRHEFFERVDEAMSAMWWIPAGHRPSLKEAEQRLIHLREHGPTPYAFTLRMTFPAGTAQGGSGSAEAVS